MKFTLWAIPLTFFSLTLWPSLCSAQLYLHEVQGKVDVGRGYSSVSIKFTRPSTTESDRPKSIVLELPLCERRSVKRIDQYCATEEGVVGQVSALTGNRLAYDTPDLSEEIHFAKFLSAQAPGRSLASEPTIEPETLCQASCFRIKDEACQAKGADLLQSFTALVQYFKTKPDDCAQCSLKTVKCDGKLYSYQSLQARLVKSKSKN